MGRVTLALWAGWALVGLGGGLTLVSRVVMGQSYSPSASNLDPGQTIVRRGPYAFFDHPQYAGNLLSVGGLLLSLNARWSWLLLAPFLIALSWRIAREERFLDEKFGPLWRSRP